MTKSYAVERGYPEERKRAVKNFTFSQGTSLTAAACMMQNKSSSDKKLFAYQQLDECPLFTQWTSNHKHTISDGAKEFSWSAGETLFELGENAKWLYLVVSGSIKGVVLTEDGEEAIIDVGSSGNWIGGLSLVDRLPHQHSAIALEDVHCIGFDGAKIQNILEENPSFYREIAFMVCGKLRSTFIWVEESLLSTTRKRVYNRMKHIAMDMGTPHEDGMIIRTRISQDVLAAMLGITRQTLNKEIGELKQSGWVQKIGAYYWVKCAYD